LKNEHLFKIYKFIGNENCVLFSKTIMQHILELNNRPNICYSLIFTKFTDDLDHPVVRFKQWSRISDHISNEGL